MHLQLLKNVYLNKNLNLNIPNNALFLKILEKSPRLLLDSGGGAADPYIVIYSYNVTTFSLESFCTINYFSLHLFSLTTLLC